MEVRRDAKAIPARILVVDDEKSTRNAVTRALNLIGYEADGAESGGQALSYLSARPYDLMLLDLRMPGLDGVEVMVRAKKLRPSLLVVILTAFATIESAIAAVRAGAVDYLLKPCSIREIEGVIARALYQRKQRLVNVMAEALEVLQSEGAPDVPYIFGRERVLRAGAMTLDRDKHLVVVTGDGDNDSISCDLTTIEADILACFMQRPGTVFSCRELARAALGYEVNEREAEEIIRPHISRLRKKIERDPANPTTIRTIRNKGYFFSS